MKDKVRYAVVGLGHIAQNAVLPAFEHAQNSELAALVSDDPVKRRELGSKYGVSKVYSYKEYGDCLAGGDVDAVFIALPNNLHRDFTLAAANSGVHILCEKPMAVTERDCEEMIEAAARYSVKLMIAYRLHFEEANLKAIEMAKSGKLGEIRAFNSLFTMNVKAGDIRLQKALGGGTLYDIGVYCINAARYLFQAEPVEVFAYGANNGERRFKEVEEMAGAVLKFPRDRIANFTCSFGAADISQYQIVGTKGDLRMDPAYEYEEELQQTVTIDGKKKSHRFARRDQFAAEILYFSDCILNNKNPEPSGLEGLADVRIIRALYQSIEEGKPVKLEPFKMTRRPTLAQEIKRPPVKEREMVHAESPHS